jgi:HK97 family phage portal protein
VTEELNTETVERARNSISSAGGGGKSINITDKEQRIYATGGFSTYYNMYKKHPIVRAAVDKIAKQSTKTGYHFRSRDSTKTLKVSDVKILSETFARSRANSLLRKSYTDLLIYGDAFWFITPSRLGVPYQFIRQDPSTVSIVIDKQTRSVTQYIVRDQQGNETSYGPLEMVHFILFDPNNEVYGLSLLESLMSTVSQDLFAQTFNEAFFANSAQTGIIFNMSGASKEEVLRNREFLKKEYVGGANAHKPLLLEGSVKMEKSVSSAADMQFIEGRRQLLSEILAVYDLPYTKLSGTSESANRSQSAENDKAFRSETIEPLQGIIEEEINESLVLGLFGMTETEFEHNEIDSRDRDTQLKYYIEGMMHGLWPIDYVRAKLEGLASIPGGDICFIQTPTGIVPVDQIPNLAAAIIAKANAGTDALGQPQPQVPDAPGATNKPPVNPTNKPSQSAQKAQSQPGSNNANVK